MKYSLLRINYNENVGKLSKKILNENVDKQSLNTQVWVRGLGSKVSHRSVQHCEGPTLNGLIT